MTMPIQPKLKDARMPLSYVLLLLLLSNLLTFFAAGTRNQLIAGDPTDIKLVNRNRNRAGNEMDDGVTDAESIPKAKSRPVASTITNKKTAENEGRNRPLPALVNASGQLTTGAAEYANLTDDEQKKA
jgi:hypothetical protein